MAEYIERETAISNLMQMVVDHSTDKFNGQLLHYTGIKAMLEYIPAADVQPVVRCKDCKHFHLDYFGEVNGANIIVAHEICDLWAGGCRTTQDAFCSNGVRKDGDDNG